MELGHLIAFNLALLVALISPGPALLFAIRTALTDGRGAGILAGVGLGLTAAFWTLLALLGLETIFAIFPLAYAAFKLAGAGYLIWIAVQTWRSAAKPLADSTLGRRRAFRGGVLLNLANPKSVLFAAAVLVIIFPPDLTAAQMAGIMLNHFVIEALFYGSVAVVLSTQAARARYLQAKPVLDRGVALVLGALGLRLLVTR